MAQENFGGPQGELDELQREEDAQFLRNLITLAGGDPAAFEGFDPSGWRDIDPNEELDDPDVAIYSDDETGGIIASANIFKKAERIEDDFDRPYKLNKAHALAADVPDVMRNPAELEKEGLLWRDTGLALGQAAPETDRFVPWKFVINHCDMFVGKRNRERAAPLFTLDALHQNRIWDLYYLHQPKELGDKPPVLFVPTYQFEHLLDVVNAKLEINLTVPSGKNVDKFNLTFGDGGGPRPRFLGRSDTADHFNSLRDNIPGPKPEDDLGNATHYGRETLLETFHMISKAASKSKKSDRSRYKRRNAHVQWGRAMKRAQRYLGLRERKTEHVEGAGVIPKILDLKQPMSTKPEQSVLFVCIDIEAYESNQSLITEVGIAVLDTARLVGVAPGVNGREWLELVMARHIRVQENLWAVNSKYVQGCAEQFDFGKSEFMKEAEISVVIQEIIDNAKIDPRGLNQEARPVVLVFHESSADIKYLRTLGYDVYAATNVIDIMDTKEMYQYIQRSNNSARLETVLQYLEIQYGNLHNAGNDAVYTLYAMVGLAVKKRLMSLEDAVSGRVKGHIPFAEFKEKEGWTSGGEDTDGGEGVWPLDPSNAKN